MEQESNMPRKKKKKPTKILTPSERKKREKNRLRKGMGCVPVPRGQLISLDDVTSISVAKINNLRVKLDVLNSFEPSGYNRYTVYSRLFSDAVTFARKHELAHLGIGDYKEQQAYCSACYQNLSSDVKDALQRYAEKLKELSLWLTQYYC